MMDEFHYDVTYKDDVGSHHFIGEVRSEDRGRSWRFKASIFGKYMIEGTCDDLNVGIISIIKALWG